jgi:hypothetical protein
MNVHRIVVQASIDELRAIPLWRNVLHFYVQVRAWKVSVDRQGDIASFSIDLVGLLDATAEEFRLKVLSSLPNAMSVTCVSLN